MGRTDNTLMNLLWAALLFAVNEIDLNTLSVSCVDNQNVEWATFLLEIVLGSISIFKTRV